MTSEHRRSRRTWGWVLLALGSPYALIVAAAVVAFGITDTAPTSRAMGSLAAFHFAPWGGLLVFGLWMVMTGSRPGSGDQSGPRRPSRTFYRVLVTMLILQAVIIASASWPRFGGPRSGAFEAAMRSDLASLRSQQEIYFANAGTYASDLDALAFVSSDGVNIEIEAGGEGWTARATHAAMPGGNHCVMHYGSTEPIPLRSGETARIPGVVRCQRSSPADALVGLPFDGLLLGVHAYVTRLTR